MQVSGITFAFDPSKATGSRVQRESVTVQGEPLQLDGRYNVGTKNFLLDGKDGYGSFKEVCHAIDLPTEVVLLPPFNRNVHSEPFFWVGHVLLTCSSCKDWHTWMCLRHGVSLHTVLCSVR